ncbi:ubiquinone biosynthesis regulatory protein kinase UbiB [Vibrio sp. SS-MA-C1-2]|uniref:ubiquinone biosynthesis regulatory protein kinase UbiB n=1 Tax=Vibrio sp. SS-MA-C1-2 TaxID=2908646 RepID=UPI001F176461|nr:ubiquinone biosynthesis regulatory protein kinase UbiB [Vibrio sp. SS-MA-C1-2]UJF19373.1 ubiquinone biosynthesis regulatory protein kinase UbiB [Vibrio sp. SS-MA-C1-2]
MRPAELKRLYKITSVLLTYGLDQLLPETELTEKAAFFRKGLFWIKNCHQEKALGERLRLALQELGPVWIKFGQMMSTRRDLFPPHIADELALLQDQVSPYDGAVAKKQIEQALGGPIEKWFDDFDINPLASASIAQVHTATLKESGEEIVLKVIRPDIKKVIQADIRLMYRLARMVSKFLPETRRLRAVEVVREYENTLLDELNLLREATNATQLRRNFEGSPVLYVPAVHTDLCRENLLVMERIYGIQVSDIPALEANGTNMKLLAERGVEVFFTQVFRDSFFHADMHPGNVFVSYDHPEDPQWIGLDCGIVGILNKEDKRYLAGNLLAFFNQDYRTVAELHVASGWVPADTNVDEFEFAIRTVCEPIFEKPLGEISFGHVLLNLFNAARRFNMEVQPQLVLLQKTLLYIEGLGRQLYPQLNLWDTAKPFLQDWMDQQLGPQAFVTKVVEKAPFWLEKIPELPELIYNNLKQGQELSHKIDSISQNYVAQQQRQSQGKFFFGIGATMFICTAIISSYAEVVPIILSVIGTVSWIIGWRFYRR